MNIYLLKDKELITNTFPNTKNGSYWIFDFDENNEERSLINLFNVKDNWLIKSNRETKIIVDNKYVSEYIVKNYSHPIIEINNEKFMLCFVLNNDIVNTSINVTNDTSLTIGKDENCNIYYNESIIESNEATLTYSNKWSIISKTNNVYVNASKTLNKELDFGDIIFILGLKIIVMKDYLIINNPLNLVKMKGNTISLKSLNNNDYVDEFAGDEPFINYEDKDYFYRSPRFKTLVEKTIVNIDAPPNAPDETKKPAILIVGPMVTMGLSSIITLIIAIIAINKGTSTLFGSITTLSFAFAMLLSSMLWPSINNSFDNKIKKEKEKKRQEKYSKYISNKKLMISNIISNQKNILLENSKSIEECQNIILNKKNNLWSVKIDEDDYLKVKLGMGKKEAALEINSPQEKFTMVEDNLVELMNSVVNESKLMEDVPIEIVLTEKYNTAIVGKTEYTTPFIYTMLLQLLTFQSYEDLKIVILTNEENANKWDKLKIVPHCWDNYKSIRFFGSNNDDIKEISTYLEMELTRREEIAYSQTNSVKDINYKQFIPYYVIIIDDLKVARKTYAIKRIMESERNLGFTIILENNRLSNLPNECFTFINIDKDVSGIFENELIANKQKYFTKDTFIPDYKNCYLTLANIPINLSTRVAPLPKMLGFLEMFNVGNISQLNILNRWSKNNPTISLATPIGVDENHDLFMLDVHEKFHGPHGLIAGMTGSGKSELIISYILSLAVNYHPNEVSMVIIDYKGGGLAGALYNKETGVKLPHIVGTITNLDTVELKRSLASIESELIKRQEIFKKTRETLNESTIDIYKYQKLFREKKVSIAIPHLLIICDEFAELKVSQPDFMDQLISTARIGRSLGVHLILATQKPAGVVNDQIWSNSRFRICLKVQERADSMDMIKREEAAALKEVGRFYLQVGYNELFKLGQSAYSGGTYIEKDKPRKKVDTMINFVNNVGLTIKNIDTEKKIAKEDNKGEELKNVVEYLYKIGQEHNIFPEPLWLESLSAFINIHNLIKKYNYEEKQFVLNPIIGEYDLPSRQMQSLLTLPISEKGNTILYGSAGSGKENFLTTIIYNIIMYHKSDEVNFYIIDCGAETMKIFNDAPHVGDVILINEQEKIVNLFKTIKNVIDERKKLFAEYNGNYYDYCTKSGKTVPNIIIIINYYEAFVENYEAFDELINQFSRECSRYGVYFILTVNATNGIRYRLRQNFRIELSLQLNDASDYSNIFSKARNKKPSYYFGRGLVELDEVYEFQTAFISDKESINDNVKEYIASIKDKQPKAKSVKILPKIVNSSILSSYYSNNENLPIGIDVNDLEPKYVNIKSKKHITFLSQNYPNFHNFLQEYFLLIKTKDSQNIIIDLENIIDKEKNKNVYNSHFNEICKSLLDYYEKANNYKSSNNNLGISDLFVYIINLTSFIDNLNDELKEKFKTLISKAKSNNINFVFVETIENFKALMFDDYFNKNVSQNSMLWLGNGISEQYTITLSKNPRFLRDEIDNNYGFIIKEGVPSKIKVIGTKLEEE